MRSFSFSYVLLLLAMFLPLRPLAADNDKINLLQLAAAKLEQSTVLPHDLAEVKKWTDGKRTTAGEVAVTPPTPVDIVFGTGGTSVSPEQIVVTLPEQVATEKAPVRVEILVSVVSPHAGFQSLRADPLNAVPDPQGFIFSPVAACWIMVRLTPGEKATHMALAEVAVMGRAEAPASHYEFNESPAEAFKLLEQLKKFSSLKIAISRDEASLFADARDGKLEQWSFAEAALLASGLNDATKRKEYLVKIERLAKEAGKITTPSKTTFAKGETLIKWLHKKSLVRYVAHQTDVSTILDNGTFNCVSSAAIYNIIGRRLGLDLRAIEVPDHAFAVLYDGSKHADVETTNDSGFNPARDKAAIEKFQKQTGFNYIPDMHRDKRREIRETGLVAIIYYNHGVGLSDEKRYHEALFAYFRALSLDPEFASAVKNVLAVLSKWSSELAGQGKFAEALEILASGLALAPKDVTLSHNHKVIWSEWALATMKPGKDDEALAILDKAAAAIPVEAAYFVNLKAWLYLREGEKLIKEGKWEEALASVEPAFSKLGTTAHAELAQWRSGLYLRWSNSELDKNNFAQAMAILEKGLEVAPEDQHFINNFGYVVQVWGQSVYDKQGEKAARDLLKNLLKRYPRPEVKKAARYIVFLLLQKLEKASQYEEALKAVERNTELMQDKSDKEQTTLMIYNNWALALLGKKKFAEALAVLEQGLQRDPGHQHLVNNLSYTVQEWAAHVYAQNGEKPAQAVLLPIKKRLANFSGVQATIKNHVCRVAQQLEKAGQYEEAIAAAQRHGDFITPAEIEEICRNIYAAWSGNFLEKRQFAQTLAILEKAFALYPNDTHFSNNIAYAIQELVKETYTREGEKKSKEMLVLWGMRFKNIVAVRDVVKQHVRHVWEELGKAGRYEEAITAIERHGDLFADKAEVENISSELYLSWSSDLIKQRQFAASVAVLEKAMAFKPGHSPFTNNLAYAVQEWLRETYDKQGEDKAREVMLAVAKKLQDVQGVGAVLQNHVHRVVQQMSQKGKYEEALSALERYQELIAEPATIAASVYDTWADSLVRKKNWQAAVDVYGKALKKYPADSHLSHNATAVWDRWAQTFIAQKDWAKAVDVYQKALLCLPGNSLLQNNLAYCQQKMQNR